MFQLQLTGVSVSLYSQCKEYVMIFAHASEWDSALRETPKGLGKLCIAASLHCTGNFQILGLLPSLNRISHFLLIVLVTLIGRLNSTEKMEAHVKQRAFTKITTLN